MNDPTAQMGFQIGKSAVDAGQQYMEQNVSCTSYTIGLRHDIKSHEYDPPLH